MPEIFKYTFCPIVFQYLRIGGRRKRRKKGRVVKDGGPLKIKKKIRKTSNFGGPPFFVEPC